MQGRGFVFASQYTKLLPAQLAGQYLEAAIQVIESPNAGIPVKISAVKAIHKYVNSTFSCKDVFAYIHSADAVSAKVLMTLH